MAEAVEVFIGLGTNLGDRGDNLRRAALGLEQFVCRVVVSPIYLSEPWGIADQRWFWNAAVKGTTRLSAQDLLARMHKLERDLGRTAGVRYGPRRIDLDLLLYGTETIDTPGLTVPHPQLKERAFVLVPLLDLAPELHSPDGRPLARVLEGLDQTGVRRIGPLEDAVDRSGEEA